MRRVLRSPAEAPNGWPHVVVWWHTAMRAVVSGACLSECAAATPRQWPHTWNYPGRSVSLATQELTPLDCFNLVSRSLRRLLEAADKPQLIYPPRCLTPQVLTWVVEHHAAWMKDFSVSTDAHVVMGGALSFLVVFR